VSDDEICVTIQRSTSSYCIDMFVPNGYSTQRHTTRTTQGEREKRSFAERERKENPGEMKVRPIVARYFLCCHEVYSNVHLRLNARSALFGPFEKP